MAAVEAPLAVVEAGLGPRLVLCHGFTQNLGCWGPLAVDLAADHQVVTIDAPGHGRSGHDHADLDEAARLIGEVGGPAVYVGYSMGGRMALHLALEQPALVRGLVLIGTTAGIEDEAEREARRLADEALADHLLEVGLATFLDEWLAGPLFAALSSRAAGRDARLENRVSGLAASLRSVGTGRQRPLWDRLAELAMPVLTMAGADDHRFIELARRLAAGIGHNAEVAVLPGGHAVHLETPGSAAESVRRLVSRVERSGRG